MWLNRLYQNHVLATLAYILVLLLGLLAYPQLPREKEPEADSRGVGIQVELPGTSSEDLERLVIDPIERLLRAKIKDIEQVESSAQGGTGTVTVVFKDIPRPLYERQVQTLRREISTWAQTALPQSKPPDIQEQNSMSADWFKILVYGPGNDDNLRRQARQVQRDLQRMPGVASVGNKGLEEPELHVLFHPERLVGLGIDPGALADTVQAYFKDIPAGSVKIGGLEWLVRINGTADAAANLAALPIVSAKGNVKLGELAEITRTSQETLLGARFREQPAIVIMPFKQPGANTLQLIDQIKTYIEERNLISRSTGAQLFLLIDSSVEIRKSLTLMEQHAWSGMLLVLAVTWLMLGTRLSLLTTLAVPFSLAGVFVALQVTHHSLNLSVLLGVVIVLGMLVDDAVVVIEAVSQHWSRGMTALEATVAALREVWLPVATSSFTTIASFLPLMLMGGFLGSLMGVVPQVVCLGLLVSLVQALWILPAQAVVVIVPTTTKDWRDRLRIWLQVRYTRRLAKFMRRPAYSIVAVLGIFAFAGAALALDWVGFNMLPPAPNYDLFISLEMPLGTPTERTLAKLEEIERRVTPLFAPGELRASAIESGTASINGRTMAGHQYGDIWFAMFPHSGRNSSVMVPKAKQALDGMEGIVGAWVEGDDSFWQGQVGKPISLELSGTAGQQLDGAIQELKAIMAGVPGVSNISLDVTTGLPELELRLNGDAIQRAGLSPATVSRAVQMASGGEVVANYIDGDETVAVRVRADVSQLRDITALLQQTVARADGSTVPLAQLVKAESHESPDLIIHRDYKRIVKLQAVLDKSKLDTLAAIRRIQQNWDTVKDHFADVHVDFGGEAKTIEQSLSQLWQKFVLGIGIIFLIVGAQFRSYVMPFLVLLKVPMAFVGLILGLLISREPISLYTLYGAIALAGIAVNSAILMFSAAHDRMSGGMGVVHATLFAARRRLLPILITSLTTLTGLLPLALGNDDASSQWRPVATAIVWGVGFSTILTLFVVPLLYRLAMGWTRQRAEMNA